MKTFKIFGLLLSYPSRDLQLHLPELADVLESETLVRGKSLKMLLSMMKNWKQEDLLDWQESYVSLFDRSRGNSLYLFEHVHGESRDRGQAMIDLSNMYKQRGLELGVSELPDFLPVFLEYLSLCPLEEAQDLLGEAVHIIAVIGTNLKVKNSTYHILFDVLQSLTEVKVDPQVLAEAKRLAEDQDDSLEQLDREWEETPAFDNGAANACQSCDLNPLNETQRGAGSLDAQA